MKTNTWSQQWSHTFTDLKVKAGGLSFEEGRGLRMRPPGMTEVTKVVAIWWLVLVVSLPSTLNTQILDRAKMTPCKFNPFCLCSNNGEKFAFFQFCGQKLKAAGTEDFSKDKSGARDKNIPQLQNSLQAVHHRPNTHLTRMSGDVCTLSHRMIVARVT